METPVPPAPSIDVVGADIKEDRELVDRILFLRSLATKSPEVDAMIEALLVVTGHWRPGTALSIRDRGALDELEYKLKNYLLTVDPARAFTPETLERRLQKQAATAAAPPANHGHGRTLLYGSLALVVAVVLLYFALKTLR